MFDPLLGRDPLRFYFRKRQPPVIDYLPFAFLVVAYGRFDSNYFCYTSRFSSLHVLLQFALTQELKEQYLVRYRHLLLLSAQSKSQRELKFCCNFNQNQEPWLLPEKQLYK